MTDRDHFVNSEHRENDKPGVAITRRAFLAGGAASALLFFMPPVWSDDRGYAYAAGQDESGEITVFVVSLNDVGFKVVDVAGDAEAPVAGAKVTLKANNGATASGTTDADGAVVIDITSVSTEVDYGKEGKRKRFDGEVFVEAGDGYRAFSVGRLRVDGGTGVQVPTRQLESPDEAYFERIGFDGWDVLYTENEFFSAVSNTETHVVSGILRAPGATRARVQLATVDKNGVSDIREEQAFELTDGRGSFSFKGAYLTPASDKALPVDGSFSLRFKADNSSYWYGSGAKAKIVKAPLDTVYSPDSGLEKALGTMTSGLSYKLPSSWPTPLGDSTISLAAPVLPVIIAASPAGMFVLGVGGKPALQLKDKANFLKGSDWKKESSKSVKQQYQQIYNDAKDDLQKYREMTTGLKADGTAMKKYEFCHQFTFDVAVQLYGVMQYLFDSSLWRGTGGIVFQFSLGGSFTMTAVVGPVPVFAGVGATASAKIAGQLGMISKSPSLIEDWNFDYTQTQLSGTITIELEISAGVGFSGLASVGLRGSGYLSYYLGIEAAHADRPLPHHVVAGGVQVDVVVQLVIFKWSGKLWGIDDPSLYNSWKDNPEGFQAAGTPVMTASIFAFGSTADGVPQYSLPGMLGADGVSLQSFEESATIVTEGELRRTREFLAHGPGSNASAGIGLSEFQPLALEADGGDVTEAWVIKSQVSEDADVTDGFSYEYIGNPPANAGLSVGVSGIGQDGGVRPTLDTVIARNVFSDPRQKIVVYKGVPYLFRILSVDYGSEGVRSRLAVQRFDLQSGAAQSPVVLEFPVCVRDSYKQGVTKIERIDMFDYDFDVLVNEEDSDTLQEGIYVLLSGGKRPEGDASTLAQVLANPVMTLLRLDEGLKVRDVVSWSDATEKHQYWSFTLPRLFKMSVQSAGKDHAALAVVYVRRYGETLEDIMPTDPKTLGCGIYVHVWAGNALYGELGWRVNKGTYDICGAALDETGWIYVVSRAKDASTNEVLTSITSFYVGKVAPSMAGRIVPNLVDQAGVEDGVPWPGHSELLTLQNGILHASTFDPKTMHGGITSRQVGPSDYQMAAFRVSPNGDSLVFARNIEGKAGQEFDESGNPTGEITANKHRVMASVCVGGLFSTPFPVADMDNPVDSLSNISSGADGSSYAFAYSVIKDMTTSTADVRFANVPAVVTATPLSLVSDRLFVLAGSEEQFTMTLRNDGNVIMTGCTVEFRDRETGALIERKERYAFAKENVVESAWTPELFEGVGVTGSEDAADEPRYPDDAIAAAGVEGNHILADPLSEGALLPGRTTTYQISFTIPADWRGTKKTYIVLNDYQFVVPGTRIAEGAEDTVLQFSLPHDECPTCDVDVHQEVAAFDPDLGDSVVTKEGDPTGGDTPAGDPDPGSGTGMAQGGKPAQNAGSKAPSAKRTVASMAKTGDKAGLTAAGLLATAAVAGMTAYTARRLENERAAEQGDGE